MKSNFKKRNIFILFIIVIIICIVSVVLFKNFNTKNLSKKMKDNMIPIKTLESNNDFEDLAPLEEILKDKKIIGVGEATHGTKEFSQMKHRMFEFLVEKMGYRLFAIEDDFGICEEINKYVLYGDGNGENLIKLLNIQWQTKEVENIIGWIRDYNENPNHKEKIKFYGIDLLNQSYDVVNILSYLEKVDKNIFTKATSLLSGIDILKVENSSTPSNIKLYKNNVEQLTKLFSENRINFIEKTSENEYTLALMNLTNLNQFVNYMGFLDNPLKLFKLRDDYMAKNISSILDYEKNFGNDKIMIWTHNTHVSKHFYNMISMGENLKNIFVDDYYAIGFEFYNGSFLSANFDSIYKTTSNSFAKNDVESLPKKGSFADVLKNTDIPIGFIDFKTICNSNKPVKIWLNKPQLLHNVGYSYDKSEFTLYKTEVPLQSYDRMIFIRDTSTSTPIN